MNERQKFGVKQFSAGGKTVFFVTLTVATLLAYQPAWHGTPIMDDERHLIAAPSESAGGLIKLWIAPDRTQQYHPLVDTVFWIEKNIWGDAMFGYHVVNILLHVGCALLLWQILRQLKVPAASVAAVIFALHPVQVESVAWIVELKNTLSGVFFFGALLVYLKFDQTRDWKTYVATAILFCCGLLAKPIVALLPIAILIVLWWKRGRIEWRCDLRPLVPFIVVGLAAGFTAARIEVEFTGAKGAAFHFSLLERFLIAGRAFWFYLAKLFWPSNLSLIYPRWRIVAAEWWQYLFPVAAILFFALALFIRKRWRWPLAALCFFGVMLLPTIGFFNVRFFDLSFVADHFQYLPSLGVIVPIAAGAGILFDQLQGARRALFVAACLTLFASLFILTWRQSYMYQDAETCYRTIIAKNPNAWAAEANLGVTLREKGRIDDAIAHFHNVLQNSPNNSYAAKVAHFNLGNSLLRKGLADEAIDHYQAAIKIAPDAEIHNSLGSALRRKGKFDEAMFHYDAALKISPQSTAALNNLAWLLATCPDPSYRNGARAIELARKANELSSGTSPVYLRTLAAAYAENGQFSDAITTAERALELSNATDNRTLLRALSYKIQLYKNNSASHEPAQ